MGFMFSFGRIIDAVARGIGGGGARARMEIECFADLILCLRDLHLCCGEGRLAVSSRSNFQKRVLGTCNPGLQHRCLGWHDFPLRFDLMLLIRPAGRSILTP